MPENLLDSKNLRNRVQKHQKIIWVQKCQKIGSKISENWPESNPAMTFLSHSRVFKIISDIFDDFFNYLLCIISRHQCFDFHVIVGSDGVTRFLFWRIARCRKIFWHKEQEQSHLLRQNLYKFITIMKSYDVTIISFQAFKCYDRIQFVYHFTIKRRHDLIALRLFNPMIARNRVRVKS